MENAGKLIVAMGIPGSGKSTVVRALANLCSAISFHEPEEESWPTFIAKRDIYGYFTAITWFRSSRVPQLFDADELREKGELVFVDSYFDKLIVKYLGKPGLEWLIPPQDSYFDAVRQMSQLDYEHLPDADVIINFVVTESVWEKFLELRGRNMDSEEGFRNCYALQEYILESGQAHSREKGSIVIDFNQEFSSPEESAESLHSLLRTKGVL